MIVDHARVIRDDRYFAKKRAKVAAANRRHDVIAVNVLHDRNEACCRREAWKTTLAKLLAPTIADAVHGDPANVDGDLVAFQKTPFQHEHCKGVLNEPLYRALQWTRAKSLVVTFSGKQMLRRRSQVN